MDDKWIDSIKTKMEGYEATPPEGLWESVQNATRTRRLRNRLILTSVAASVALVIGCFFALVPEGQISPAEDIISEVSAIEEFAKAPDNRLLAKTETSTSIDSDENHCESAMEKNSIITADNEINSDTTFDTSHPESKEYPDAESIEYSDAEAVEFANTDALEYENPSSDEAGANVMASVKSEGSGFSVGIATYANGIGGLVDGSNLTGVGAGNISGFHGYATRGGGFSSNSTSPSPTSPAPDTSSPTQTEVFDHRLPLRFSLTLSFPIYRNLYIDTGIAYSYLKSYIKYGDTQERASEWIQGLHYLGIPVNLRYIPWRINHFDFYASGGVMLEKCIAGSIKGKDSPEPSYYYEGCHDRPYQFSVNAAVGLQYDITRKLGIYIEPGVGYYFKNSSRLRTIYTERPLTFNLNLGIRID